MNIMKCTHITLLVFMAIWLISACSSSPHIVNKEITVSELCNEDSQILKKEPLSFTYSESKGSPDTYSVKIDDLNKVSKVFNIILNTKVINQGEHVDMYWINYEDFCFDFGEESYTFSFLSDSYVSYNGMYYEITESKLEVIRSIISEFGTENEEPVNECDAVSEWYERNTVFESVFYDNGDEAPSCIEISISSSKGTVTGYINGAYDVLSIERFADCYTIEYTYGDFYNHNSTRKSRITVEEQELSITIISE